MNPQIHSVCVSLARYVVPGCVEDGAWMLWGNSSVAVVAAAVLARYFLDEFSQQSSCLVISHALWGYVFLRVTVFKNELSPKAVPPVV